MLPEIGIMIGFYILSRTLFLLRERELTRGTGGVIVSTFAVVTLLVTAFIIFDLLVRGVSTTGNALPY